MRALLYAYHEMGYVGLEAVLAAGWKIAAVVTHPDDPHEERWYRSVAELARRHRIPVHIEDDPNRPELAAWLSAYEADYAFSFWFRKLLTAPLLAAGRRGALNLHGSLLPKYRGRCPVNWVLVNGETRTGVTLHYMDLKPDHGDIVAQRAVAIAPEDTALTLYRKLAACARGLLAETLPGLAAGDAPRLAQDHAQSSYFGGRTAADGLIDWSWPAERVRNLVRAVTRPWPGAFTTCAGAKLTIWSGSAVEAPRRMPGEVVRSFGGLAIATGAGAFRPERVQRAGEPERSWENVCSWLGLEPGDHLEQGHVLRRSKEARPR